VNTELELFLFGFDITTHSLHLDLLSSSLLVPYASFLSLSFDLSCSFHSLSHSFLCTDITNRIWNHSHFLHFLFVGFNHVSIERLIDESFVAKLRFVAK